MLSIDIIEVALKIDELDGKFIQHALQLYPGIPVLRGHISRILQELFACAQEGLETGYERCDAVCAVGLPKFFQALDNLGPYFLQKISMVVSTRVWQDKTQRPSP